MGTSSGERENTEFLLVGFWGRVSARLRISAQKMCFCHLQNQLLRRNTNSSFQVTIHYFLHSPTSSEHGQLISKWNYFVKTQCYFSIHKLHSVNQFKNHYQLLAWALCFLFPVHRTHSPPLLELEPKFCYCIVFCIEHFW